MSFNLVNGKLVPKVPDGRLDAPTPSQIAERAYDLAVMRAYEGVLNLQRINAQDDANSVREFMRNERAEQLAALRESVINPGVVPWWRNR